MRNLPQHPVLHHYTRTGTVPASESPTFSLASTFIIWRQILSTKPSSVEYQLVCLHAEWAGRVRSRFLLCKAGCLY